MILSGRVLVVAAVLASNAFLLRPKVVEPEVCTTAALLPRVVCAQDASPCIWKTTSGSVITYAMMSSAVEQLVLAVHICANVF